MIINSISNPYQYQPYNFQKNLNVSSHSSDMTVNSNTSSKEVQTGEACQTCNERKYLDGSDDPSVSFKTAGHIDPEDSASVVKSHEMEHVANEQASAKSKGKEVVSQSVALHTSVCPECGKTYVSGGTTKTTTKSETELPFNLGESNLKGHNVDEFV
ncbi:MAG: hypothetical protein E7208_11570 [Clostridium butyricum]|nr:hypothetical protein [Clostridium butyricum]